MPRRRDLEAWQNENSGGATVSAERRHLRVWDAASFPLTGRTNNATLESLFLLLEKVVIFADEVADFICDAQELLPLLSI
jgi:hypothetical protein